MMSSSQEHRFGRVSTPDAVTFLVVEDDLVDQRAVRRGLRRHGIDNPIVFAEDGKVGLEILRGTGDTPPLRRPYIVLLDLNMPRMNGLEFLEEVRNDPELTGSIIFVLTTSDLDRDKAAAYEQHVAGYLLKTQAGVDFLNVVSMLERFVVTVRFPPEAGARV